MAGHEWEDWFEREEFIGQISDMRVQNLQVEREVVQKRTFTRWMNLHLEKCDPPIEVHDLFRDIQDGHILMALLEELSGCKLLHGFKKSTHRIFRLNNIAKVLSFLEERNVKLVSIDASDVADGNSSIILGLIWNIILFFQIKELTGNIRSQFPSSSSLSSIPTSSDSDASYCSTPSEERQTASTAMRDHSKAIKKLLQWVQKRTRKYGVAVQDFGKSWTSGLAFLAVIKSIDPSLVDMRKALLRTARENLEDAFRIAHYSLGIPRLLEPEDLTINTPDEQSIIIYVSQFLEHFPGIEEDEQSRLIERSVSMCRLNYTDSEYMKNGTHRGRVKERSHMFEKDSSQPPPKILISSVSVDRSAKLPSFRVAASRSWSSEDILADTEDPPSRVVKESKEPSTEVSTSSTSNPPQLTYTQSPTSSSVPESVNTESVIGDSAISSPDSWVESEFGVTPEKFCESRSDSSLCDSGTAWDVYRATPVEITSLDDVVPSIEDKASDEQSIAESYTDEGIYSLSSLESTQERNQVMSEKKQEEVENRKDGSIENCDQQVVLEEVSQSETKIKNELDSETEEPDQHHSEQKQEQSTEGSTNSGGKDLLQPFKPSPLISITGPSFDLEDLAKQTSVEENIEPESDKKAVDFTETVQDQGGQVNGPTESKNVQNNAEEVEVGAECQKKDCSSEESTGKSKEDSGILKKKDKGDVRAQDRESEGAQSSQLESTKTEVCDEDGASKTGPAPGVNIPVISISSEPEEHEDEGMFDKERGGHDAEDVVRREEDGTGKDEAVKDIISSKNPEESISGSKDNKEKKPNEVSCSLESENVKNKSSELNRDHRTGHLDSTGEHSITDSSNSDLRKPDMTGNENKNEVKEDTKPENVESLMDNTEKDLIAQSSSTLSCAQPEADLTDQPDRQKGALVDPILDTTVEQQSTSDPVNPKPNGTAGIVRAGSKDLDLFDRSSPTDDLLGDPIEPMDLFYPDKEEPMATEPLDSEVESWPSVLSVSPLQPAPASETLQDDQPLVLLEEDFSDKVDSTPDDKKLITQTHHEPNKPFESQDDVLLQTEGLWGGDVSLGRSDLMEAEKPSSDSARENTETVRIDSKISSRHDEVQIPPVLRHRKGARLTESTNNTVAAKRNTDNTAVWWSDGWELYLLLLLWLLLYCFWILPQMDLKSLPSLLLNL